MSHMTVSTDNTIATVMPVIIHPAADFTAKTVSQEAAPLRVEPAAVQTSVLLDKPKINIGKIRELVESFKKMEMDLTVEILLLLLKLALEERKNNIALRNIQQDAVIEALNAQVSEMKTAANMVIAMTIVSGLTTFVSLTGGVYGIKRGGELKFDGLSKKEQFTLGKEFDAIQMKSNLFNTTTQGVSQMLQNGIGVKQKDVEASCKEDETDASIEEKRYQHALEQTNYFQGFMADMRDLLKQMTSNAAQAYSTAAAV